MLYAAVRHGRAYGSTVASIDDAKAKTMPGVRLIMAVPQGVAVVADQYWQAVKAWPRCGRHTPVIQMTTPLQPPWRLR